MRWPQYVYCNGLGTQNMKDPCHSWFSIINHPGGRPIKLKSTKKKRWDLSWLEDLKCVGNSCTRRQASHTQPALDCCPVMCPGSLTITFQHQKDQHLDNSHTLLPGSLQLLRTNCPAASCDLLVCIIFGGFQGRLWAYMLQWWVYTLEPGNW